jgi:AbrB family looped-hinge helix DNA binding protein
VSRQAYLMKATISAKGQLVLPRALRERDGIESGQEFSIERVRAGEYRLVRSGRRNEGLVARLLACPEKGCFVPLDSESTRKC